MIPQELVEAILSDVDPGSLKSCSLVSPGFCVPSQRLIFRSFRLEGGRKGPTILSNYSRAYTLLTDSPHLAAYITHLEIYLPTPSTSGDEINSLRHVLPLLAHVQHCLLHGVYTRARWSQYPKLFSLDVLGFLSRQKLHSLSVKSLEEMPPLAFLSFITSAPKLHFAFDDILWGSEELLAVGPPAAPTFTELLLGKYTDGVSSLLYRPQFAAYIGDLRRLTITILNPISIKLVSATAYTLTHVCLDCRVFNEPHFSIPFPPLPNICSLEILLDFARRMQPWFMESISQILPCNSKSSPPEIIVSYSRVEHYQANHGYITLLQMLETFLLSHSAIPSLIWRLGYGPLHVREQGFANFADLVDFFRRATPTLHLMGRVSVEKFVLDWRNN